MWDTLKGWDLELFIYLNNLGIERFDCFWIFITQAQSWIILFIYFIILIFYFYGSKKGGIIFFFVMLSVATALIISSLAKEYVGRIRPNNVTELTGLIRVLQDPSTFSFFSGHAV